MKITPKFEGLWKEQLARTRRWHLKTQEISRKQNTLSEEELDVLFAFFMNSWHLYDWLKISNALSTDTLDEFFRKNKTMKLCYDICIGAKHLRIDYPKGSFNQLIFAYNDAGDGSEITRTQLILGNDGPHDLTGLADDCISAIESFLRENKLL